MDIMSGLQAIFGVEPSSKLKNTQKSEAQHRQDSDLRKRNIVLKEQLSVAQERINQLEIQIDTMKEENTQVGKKLDVKKEELDQMIRGVEGKLQDMINSVHSQVEQVQGQLKEQGAVSCIQDSGQLQEQIALLDGKLSQTQEGFGQVSEELQEKVGQAQEQIQTDLKQIQVQIQTQLEQIEKQVGQMGAGEVFEVYTKQLRTTMEQITELKELLEKMSDESKALKVDVLDKIHMENVKCYRNIKSLISDLEERQKQVELSDESLWKIRKSFKGLKFLAFFAFLDFFGIAFIILYMLGYIPL